MQFKMTTYGIFIQINMVMITTIYNYNWMITKNNTGQKKPDTEHILYDSFTKTGQTGPHFWKSGQWRPLGQWQYG